MKKIKIGDSVKLNDEWLKDQRYGRSPKAGRTGIVKGYSDGNCIIVIWDGTKTGVPIHEDYVDLVNNKQ
jgi:hypothetical protein